VSISFKCASCGKAYKVGDEFAGKKVKCACGAAFVVPKALASPKASAAAKAAAAKPAVPKAAPAKPAAPSKSAAPVTASFLDDELASAEKTCPSCKTKVKFDTVLCIKCGYNFRERKKVESHVATAAPASAGMKCTKCGSQDTRKVNDNELEAYKDRKETAVAIGRPLICNKCGHMFEPPASLGNYLSSYLRGTAIFVAGAVVVAVACFIAWKSVGGALMDEDGASSRRLVRAVRANYFTMGVLFAGLSLAGAGLWGMLRTLIVQMGWKGVLYDPDENKW
jgi:hypothetical protein